LLIFLATPLLLLHLGTGDPVDMMELFNLIPVREAFRDGHWLMPTLNGAPRLEKPPLPVWIPAAFATLFRSDNLWVLRLPSLLMGLVTAIATYGIGCTLFKNPADALSNPPHQERRYALLAAVLLPAMLTFNRQARLASYDIYATAFLTCGAYFLLLLAERGKTPGERAPRPLAWLVITALAGIATGLAILSKGPVPVATVMLPLGLWLMIYHRRPRVWVGVLLAALVSLLTFMPWLIAIGGLPGKGDAWLIEPRSPEVQNAWKVWKAEFVQFGTGTAANTTAGTRAELTNSPFYYFQMLIWVLPLTPTLIAGLILPFVRSQGEPPPSDRERRGRFLLWLILVLGLLLLTVPSEKKPRYALQLFPYAALLCAAVWQEFVRFPAAKKVDLGGGLVLVSQALFFLVPALAGLLTTLWVAFTGGFFRWPMVAEAIRTAGVPFALLLFAGLAGTGAALWHLLANRRFAQGARVLALCAWLFLLTVQFLYKGLPETHTNPARAPIDAALRTMEPDPILTIGPYRPWLSSLYFSDRILPVCDPSQVVEQFARAPRQVFLMLVTDTIDGKTKQVTRMPGLDALLASLEQQTSRRPEEIAHWVDEGRRTALYCLSKPTTPASSSATAPATPAAAPSTSRAVTPNSPGSAPASQR
jgi:4-amino-4-deoxy-L-arabinose transferase-like glycosyltransferase